MKLSRKEFLQLSVTFVGVGLLGCGGDNGGADLASSGADLGPAGPSCIAQGTQITIGSNHGHSITVAVADIKAGVDKTYAIMGTSPHSHDVMLTAAHFSALTANSSVSTVSTSTAGHTHAVTISCA